ncbi:RAMP superfamily CRISPR-associated protein, partial [Oscillibacter sp.]
MSGQTTLRVTMELLSDTIFGSGFSIPGGEDIAVCRDDADYPYLKGSTLKGLLR